MIVLHRVLLMLLVAFNYSSFAYSNELISWTPIRRLK